MKDVNRPKKSKRNTPRLKRHLGANKTNAECLRRYGIGVEYFPEFNDRHLPTHTHDFIEMVFFVNGCGFHEVENLQKPIRAGQLAVVHYGQSHTFHPESDLGLVNIYLDPKRLPLPLLQPPLDNVLALALPLMPGFRHEQSRFVSFDIEEAEFFFHLLLSLGRELATNKIGGEEVREHHIQLLMIHLCRGYLRHEKNSPSHLRKLSAQSATAAKMESIRLYIDRNFRRPITLESLASLAGRHPNYLCRAFKNWTGKTPVTYIQDRRLEYVMLKLRTSNQRIIEIATDAGFGDLSHFNRTFQKAVKISPTTYRNSFKTD